MYLVLEVDAPRIHALYPKNTTLENVYFFLIFIYGTITLYGASFQKTLTSSKRKMTNQHHISNVLLRQIQFVHFLFSVALTNRISLISFPAGTKTLQFPAFPDLSICLEEAWSHIRISRVQRLPAPTPSLLQLVTSFIGTPNQQPD